MFQIDAPANVIFKEDDLIIIVKNAEDYRTSNICKLNVGDSAVIASNLCLALVRLHAIELFSTNEYGMAFLVIHRLIRKHKRADSYIGDVN